MRETAQRFGRIDICVANAGGPPSKTFAETTVEDWKAAADLNLMSTVYLAREVLPGMQQRRWGRFIAITSVTVKQPVDGLILSNSVRSAVSGLIKTLANEYGPHNVLVNNVCPGYTATARLESLTAKLAAAESRARGEDQASAGRVRCRCAVWASRKSSRTWWCSWPRNGRAISRAHRSRWMADWYAVFRHTAESLEDSAR